MKTFNIRNQTTHDTALLLLRVIVGTVFVYHGSQKLFGGLDGFAGYLTTLGVPFPHFNAALAAGTEFLGGIALILGFATGWFSIPLTITMAVACYSHANGGFSAQNGGMEYPLTLGIVTVAIGLLGSGRFAVNALRNRSKDCCRKASFESVPVIR